MWGWGDGQTLIAMHDWSFKYSGMANWQSRLASWLDASVRHG
jgi:hypothetical protein